MKGNTYRTPCGPRAWRRSSPAWRPPARGWPWLRRSRQRRQHACGPCDSCPLRPKNSTATRHGEAAEARCPAASALPRSPADRGNTQGVPPAAKRGLRPRPGQPRGPAAAAALRVDASWALRANAARTLVGLLDLLLLGVCARRVSAGRARVRRPRTTNRSAAWRGARVGHKREAQTACTRTLSGILATALGGMLRYGEAAAWDEGERVTIAGGVVIQLSLDPAAEAAALRCS